MGAILSLGLTAASALRENKLRTSLTLLGIIIGVGSVIGIVALGQSVESSIRSQISGFGATLINVTKTSDTQQVSNFDGTSRLVARVSDEDVLDLLNWNQGTAYSDVVFSENSAGVVWVPGREVLPGRSQQFSQFFVQQGQGFGQGFSADNVNTFTTLVYGVTPEFVSIYNYEVQAGTFLNTGHISSSDSIAVLGSGMAQTLFGSRSPLGASIKVEGHEYTVIGAIDGSAFNFTEDAVFLPITRYVLDFGEPGQYNPDGSLAVSRIVVKALDDASIPIAVQQITTWLQIRFGRDALKDFDVESNEMLLQDIQSAIRSFQLFLGAVAAVSLLVGGIGVMNTMLVAVAERTREIGLRRALGAKRHHILVQFIFESVAITLFGGVLGILCGYFLGIGLAIFLSQQGGPTDAPLPPPELSASLVAVALGVSVGVGLFFGIYPAFRASRLQPVDALRRE